MEKWLKTIVPTILFKRDVYLLESPVYLSVRHLVLQKSVCTKGVIGMAAGRKSVTAYNQDLVVEV